MESLTETMVLIHRGRLLAQGSVREVRRLISRHPSRVDLTANDPRGLASALREREHVRAVHLGTDPGALRVETDDIAAFHGAFAGLAARTRAGVTRFQSDDASLEAVFDYLVG